jgi:regulator of sigma E protease
MSLRGVGQIITGQRSGDDVGGIIRIAEMSGDISRTRGFWDFISFMALLSINLGLINLFPIPLLDGGHVVIYLLEIVSRREINAKIKEILFKCGLVFILFLMVFATWNDIKHLITRWFE